MTVERCSERIMRMQINVKIKQHTTHKTAVSVQLYINMTKISDINKQSHDRECLFPPTDHYVVINLRLDGKIIGTKETKGTSGPNPVWNAPFLFDLPSGDITQLPLVLEFIVMQVGTSM